MFQPAINVLVAASSESKVIALQVLNFLAPFYSSDFTKNSGEKKVILSCLLPFMKVIELNKALCSGDAQVQLNYQNLAKIYITSARNNDNEVRKLAFTGIYEYISFNNEELRHLLYDMILDNIRIREDVQKR